MLPQQIAHAVETGRLMVLAGAGISKDAPSRLPDWMGFNRSILDAIRGAALELLPDCGDAIAKLEITSIPVAAFSDAIVRTFAGDSYFPVLRVLESHAPNRNHEGLAELARRGGLAAIFTTNFDTLIEQAFAAKGVELRLFVDRSDFTGVRVAPPCALFKLHGSVKQTTTLIDTVTQKLRGLPPYVRYALSHLDQRFPLLVIGFSGTDLEFDDDYIPLLDRGRHVTWVVNPGRPASAHVRAKLDEIGGTIIEAALPQVFAEVGIVQAEPPEMEADEDADAAIRKVIDAWVRLEHIGPLTCAAVCAELLHAIGEDTAARSIAAKLDAMLREAKELPLTAAKVLRVLGSLALDAGDTDGAIFWYQREYDFHDSLYALATPGAPASASSERIHNQAATLVNLGVALRQKKELESARAMFERARAGAIEIASPYLLARIEFNLAEIADDAGADSDVVLAHARNSARHAREAGHAAAVTEAHLLAARTLLPLGEYHAAEQELDEARAVMNLNSDRVYQIEITRCRAELAARRGEDAEALAEFQNAYGLCGERERARKAVISSAAFSLAHSAQARPWLASLLDGKLEVWPERPLFFAQKARGARPDIRQALIVSEHRQDATARVHLLVLLLREDAIYQRPRRMRDVALALLNASQNSGDLFAWDAWNGLGIAADQLGEFDEAVDAYRHAIAAAPAPRDRALTTLNLALIVSRNGTAAEAEALFIEAQKELETGPAGDRTRLYLNWARHRLRTDQEGALELARKGRESAANVDHPGAVFAADQLIEEIEGASSAPPAEDSASDLGNAGLELLEDGKVQEARRLIEKAMALYEVDGDELGVSRCLNNLADCASAEGKIEDAIGLATRALEIRHRLGDVAGEALTRATLAWWLIETKKAEEALDHARRARLLLQGEPISRVTAMAEAAFGVALGLLGHGIEARASAKHAMTLIAASDDPSLRGLVALLLPLAQDPPAEKAGDPARPPSAIEAMLRESERLKRISQFDSALDLLSEAAARPDATPEDLGRIAGDRANVLQDAGRDLEAADQYRIAADLLRAIGNVQLAQMAITQGAVSLRRAGEIGRSEQWLRDVLAEPALEPIASQARLALAKSVALPFLTREEAFDATDPRCAEALKLVGDALTANPNDGHALLTSAQFNILQNRTVDAELELEQARTAFLRINSPHVELVEVQLAQLRGEGVEDAP